MTRKDAKRYWQILLTTTVMAVFLNSLKTNDSWGLYRPIMYIAVAVLTVVAISGILNQTPKDKKITLSLLILISLIALHTIAIVLSNRIGGMYTTLIVMVVCFLVYYIIKKNKFIHHKNI